MALASQEQKQETKARSPVQPILGLPASHEEEQQGLIQCCSPAMLPVQMTEVL